MSENEKTTPQRAFVQLEGDTLRRVGELMEPVMLWARREGLPPPSPADVVELAVAVLHGQVAAGAEALAAGWQDDGERPAVRH